MGCTQSTQAGAGQSPALQASCKAASSDHHPAHHTEEIKLKLSFTPSEGRHNGQPGCDPVLDLNSHAADIKAPKDAKHESPHQSSDGIRVLSSAAPSGSPGMHHGACDPQIGHDDTRAGGSARSSFASDALPPGRGSRRPGSIENPRRSHQSAHLGPVLDTSFESARSSNHARMSSIQAAGVMGIAVEKAPSKGAPGFSSSLRDPLADYTPAEASKPAYYALGALLPNTPVPMVVLKRLWGLDSSAAALEAARQMATGGILRLANLEDGSTWALPDASHITHCGTKRTDLVRQAHATLLESYTGGPDASQRTPLESLRDDGYIVQALSHHLLGCGKAGALKRLLMDPGWLEAKLHAYGTGAVVADFRRYLQATEDDQGGVKLVLQAFQLSLGGALEHPNVRMVREQMLARLMAVSEASLDMQEWYEEQATRCAADSMLVAGKRLLHLMPRTASLTQAGGMHRMTLRGHTGPIRRVVISPNGSDVITIGDDGMAQVHDMNIGDCVMHLARDSPLTAAAVAPDSSVAVVGAADGTACIWDLAAGKVSHTLPGHTERITALAIDKQGLRCITASEDHTARVWSIYDGRCEAVLAGHGGAAGKVGCVLDVCISNDGTLALTASDDFSARVWDLDEDGECLQTLEGHSGWVTSCSFIGTTQQAVTASHDGTARIWDAYKGRCLMVLSGHTGRINRATTDPGGSWAVTASDDFTARIWDVESGQCLQVLSGVHEGYVLDAVISRDGRKVVTVSGDHRAACWDAASGKCDAVLEGHSADVTSVVLTLRGRFAVTASDDCTARVWDLEAHAITAPPCHSGRVTALQALPSGELVVSAGEDGRVYLWDPITGMCLRQHEGHGAGVRFMRVSADGKHVATGSGDRKVCKWNWELYKALAAKRHSMELHHVLLRSGATGSNNTVGTGAGSQRSSGESPDLFLFNALALGQPKGKAPVITSPLAGDARTSTTSTPRRSMQAQPHNSHHHHQRSGASVLLAEEMAAIQKDPLHSSLPAQQGSRVKHIAFDQGCRTAAVLLFDSTVGIWDIDGGKCSLQLIKRGERDASRTHSGGVNAVYLTRDGSTAITISKDCTARIWDVASGATRAIVEGHTDGIITADISPDESLLATAAYDKTVRISRLGVAAGMAAATVAVLDHPTSACKVAFSGDGRRLAVALENHTVVIWDLQERSCLPALDGHSADINTMAWSECGQFLLTGSQDCTLRVWRAADGRQHAFFMADSAITSCCFAGCPNWDIIAAGDAAGKVHFCDFAEELKNPV